MKTRLLTLALLLCSALSALAVPPVEEGKSIFTSRCAGCHSVTRTLTGPALAGVDQRRSMDWIINFVHSSQTMVKKGDKDAVALFEKFNKIPMPDHTDLSDDNIKNIVAYIQSEANAKAEPIALAATKTPAADYIGFSSRNYGLLLVYAVLLTLLIGSSLFLVQVKAYKRRMEQEQA